jgi:coproporphyrinogen III oxidase
MVASTSAEMLDLSSAQGAAQRFKEFEDRHQTISLSTATGRNIPADDPILSIAADALKSGRLQPEELRLLAFVRDLNREMFKAIDPQGQWTIKSWNKSEFEGKPQGGGVMSVVRGPVLEKAAVNMSVVWGPSYPSIEKEYSGQPYLAAGVSLIGHPYNPEGPIAHMNIRVLKVGTGEKSIYWMGGGGDLTPMQRHEEDTQLFHSAFRTACDSHPLGDYERYTKWCDEYFFIPHRGEIRGVGGIFFDYLKVEENDDLGLLLNVGQSFAHTYGEILSRRVAIPFSDELKEKHLYWRARYAEFNLVHDRGTRFGLMSGGNTEAIFASLPPVVKW